MELWRCAAVEVLHKQLYIYRAVTEFAVDWIRYGTVT